MLKNIYSQTQIVNIIKQCFKRLEKYSKESDYFIYDQKNNKVTYSDRVEHNLYSQSIIYTRNLMLKIEDEQNLNSVACYLAILNYGNRGNCGELCALLSYMLFNAGLDYVETIVGIKEDKYHNFLLVYAKDETAIVIDPFFDLICSLNEYQTNYKVLAYFELKEPFDYTKNICNRTTNTKESFEKNKEEINNDLILYLEIAKKLKSGTLSLKDTFPDLFFKPDTKNINNHNESIKRFQNNLLNNKKNNNPIKLFQNNQFNEAMIIFEQHVITSREKTLFIDAKEKDFLDLATALYNVGSCLIKLNKKENAIQPLTEALEIRKKYLSDVEIIKKTADKLADCCNSIRGCLQFPVIN
jgi:tetratricopeptide (TPR) repeat protein